MTNNNIADISTFEFLQNNQNERTGQSQMSVFNSAKSSAALKAVKHAKDLIKGYSAEESKIAKAARDADTAIGTALDELGIAGIQDIQRIPDDATNEVKAAAKELAEAVKEFTAAAASNITPSISRVSVRDFIH